jgi:hypothetical protein
LRDRHAIGGFDNLLHRLAHAPHVIGISARTASSAVSTTTKSAAAAPAAATPAATPAPISAASPAAVAAVATLGCPRRVTQIFVQRPGTNDGRCGWLWRSLRG